MINIKECHLGGHDYTRTIQKALDKGGRVFIPSGYYISGPLELRSHTTLELEAGAVLEFRGALDTHPVVFSQWEGLEQEVYMPLIYGKDLEHVAIIGRGIIKGSGHYWWPKKGKLDYPRPRMLCLEDSKNILIEGVTFMDSPAWTLNPIRCENVTVDKVTINNPKDSPNTDGINPDSCKNVHISNCHVDVGDDCITIKSGVEASKHRTACENLTISNCTLVHGHGGVVIGSEMSGDVRNVVISNCIFDGTDRGIRIKTRRGRGGIVEDIRVSNIIMNDVICPIVMNMYYHCGEEGKLPRVSSKETLPVDESTPSIRRIHLENITAKNISACVGFIYGLPESPIEEVSLRNISLICSNKEIPGQAAMLCHEPNRTRAGFVIRHADVEPVNIKIQGHIGPDFI